MAQTNAVDALIDRIALEFESLPKQLKTIAKYVEQNRGKLMVARISDIAANCGVQPSAVTRFSQRLGFSGFSDLQAVFRQHHAEQTNASENYSQRIRTLIDSQDKRLSVEAVTRNFIGACRAGMEEMERQLEPGTVEAAVKLLFKADNIYVVGARRSFPVAYYTVYALQHTKKRVHLVSGLGGLYREQMRSIAKEDVLLAISFAPYAKETQYCVRVAHAQGAKIITITDSKLSPLARDAAVTLVVKEASVHSFRSLTSTLALCQGLFISLAYRLELDLDEPEHPEDYDV